MSELRRWREDGASPGEISALDAARDVKMSPASRARIVGALGVGASTLAAASASGAAGTGAATNLGVAAKIIVGMIVIGAGSGAIWHFAGRPRSADSVATTESAEPSESAAPATTTAITDTTATAAPEEAPPGAVNEQQSAPPASAPRAIASAPRARSAPAPSGSALLLEEVAALDRARKALAGDAPEAALGELAKYSKRFPQGTLAAEQTVLRVQALLAGRKNAEAVALADGFAAAHPDSPYAHRLAQLVAGVRKKK